MVSGLGRPVPGNRARGSARRRVWIYAHPRRNGRPATGGLLGRDRRVSIHAHPRRNARPASCGRTSQPGRRQGTCGRRPGHRPSVNVAVRPLARARHRRLIKTLFPEATPSGTERSIRASRARHHPRGHHRDAAILQVADVARRQSGADEPSDGGDPGVESSSVLTGAAHLPCARWAYRLAAARRGRAARAWPGGLRSEAGRRPAPRTGRGSGSQVRRLRGGFLQRGAQDLASFVLHGTVVSGGTHLQTGLQRIVQVADGQSRHGAFFRGIVAGITGIDSRFGAACR